MARRSPHGVCALQWPPRPCQPALTTDGVPRLRRQGSRRSRRPPDQGRGSGGGARGEEGRRRGTHSGGRSRALALPRLQATMKKARGRGAEGRRRRCAPNCRRTVKQKMSLAASVKETQAQLETVRGELKTATERGEIASRQLGEARKTNEKLETTRDELDRWRATSSAREDDRRRRTAQDPRCARGRRRGPARRRREEDRESRRRSRGARGERSASRTARAKRRKPSWPRSPTCSSRARRG